MSLWHKIARKLGLRRKQCGTPYPDSLCTWTEVEITDEGFFVDKPDYSLARLWEDLARGATDD